MTIVKHQVTKPVTGKPWANAEVKVALTGAGLTSAGEQVLGVSSALTDATGLVQFDLTPTDTMTPAGCYYTWTLPDGSQLTADAPSTGGPFWLKDRLVVSPTLPGAFLGVSQVDGRTGAVSLADIYAPIGSLPTAYTDWLNAHYARFDVAQVLTDAEIDQILANIDAGRIPAGVTVFHVTKGTHASDSNDGLTWGSAFLTLGAAATAAAAAPKSIVLVGPGDFTENKVVRPSGCHIDGMGWKVTTVKLANGQNTNVIEDQYWGSQTAVGDGGGVTRLTIDGNKANQTLAPARAWTTTTVNLSSSTPTTLYVHSVAAWVAAGITSGTLWVGLDLVQFTGVVDNGTLDPSNPTTTGGKFTGVTKVASGSKTYTPEAYVTPGAQWGIGLAYQSSRTITRDVLFQFTKGSARAYQGAGGSGSIAYENKGFNNRSQQCDGWDIHIGAYAPDGMEAQFVGGNAALGSVLVLSQDWQFHAAHPAGVYQTTWNARNAPTMFMVCASNFKLIGALFDTPAYSAITFNDVWTQQPISGTYIRVANCQYGSWASSGAAAAIAFYHTPDPGTLTMDDWDVEIGMRSRFLRGVHFQPTSETVMASGSFTTPASTDPTGASLQVLNALPFSGLGSAIAGTLAVTNTSTGAALDTISYVGRSSWAAPVVTAAAAGDTSLAVDDASGFAASGTVTVYPNSSGTGSVRSYAVTYTGKSGNTLTGIPTSGTGSIPASLPVGTGIAQHYLTGVRSTGAGGVAIPDASTVAQSGGSTHRQLPGIVGRLHCDTQQHVRPGGVTYPTPSTALAAQYQLAMTGRIQGKVNPYRGVVTIAVGQTSASAAHTLSAKPTLYRASPMDGDPQQRVWATADSTNVTANLSAAAAGTSVKCMVEAAMTFI